ncbi:LYR motif-containing protein 4 isoform X1 [Aquarana catesbeiana]|uniref:LYR motif-containing protein 4 isoform X1 n=2 Tax=Aquarana catesbeiana TaxID=8400 RepID=UPI003CC97FA8
MTCFKREKSVADPIYSYFNKARKGFLKMASSSRTQVLNLYKIMLRESQKFSSYNYRTYAIRRIRDAFREKKNIDDFHEVQTLVYQAKENLDIIRRQTSIGHLYANQKLVIESSESQ